MVVYYYCGSHVASLALGSAGNLMKQISNAVSIPELVGSAMMSTHVTIL